MWSHSLPENTLQLCVLSLICLASVPSLVAVAVVFLAALSALRWWCCFICQEFFSRHLHGTLNILFEIPYVSNSLVLFLLGCLYIDLWVSFADLLAQTSLVPGCQSALIFFSWECLIKRISLFILVILEAKYFFQDEWRFYLLCGWHEIEVTILCLGIQMS